MLLGNVNERNNKLTNFFTHLDQPELKREIHTNRLECEWLQSFQKII